MSDYISREVVREYIYHTQEPLNEYQLDELPAADVKPVVLGWWVNEPDRYRHWHCSECGYTISGIEIAYHYCPNCGADMREIKE